MQANERAWQLRSKLFDLIGEFRGLHAAICDAEIPCDTPGSDFESRFLSAYEACSQVDAAACELARLHDALPDLFIDAARDPKSQNFGRIVLESQP